MKSKHRTQLGLLALLPLLGACAIRQEVQRVTGLNTTEVCVIKNSKVRDGFETSVAAALRRQGYAVRTISEDSPVTACEVSMTYTANWRWDLATYMAYAEMRVFNAGKESGKAIYDSTRGGGNMGKFINADTKIATLVGELFPPR